MIFFTNRKNEQRRFECNNQKEKNEPVNLKQIDRICKALQCKSEDVNK